MSDLLFICDLSTLQDGTYNISIGERLSRDLNVSIGDTITLMTQDKFMSPLGSLPRMKKFNILNLTGLGYQNHSLAARASQLENGK